MPGCEKCWRDTASAEDHAAAYHALIEARDASGDNCTPAEQAGPDATECPKCERRTVHQYARICMACGFDVSGGDEP